MEQVADFSGKFPKSARLLKHRDFFFRPYHRFHAEKFTFVFTERGKTRMGISISKKVLPRAIARNRVRRLLKEAFRLNKKKFSGLDVHVVGRKELSLDWKSLTRAHVEQEFGQLLNRVG